MTFYSVQMYLLLGDISPSRLDVRFLLNCLNFYFKNDIIFSMLLISLKYLGNRYFPSGNEIVVDCIRHLDCFRESTNRCHRFCVHTLKILIKMAWFQTVYLQNKKSVSTNLCDRYERRSIENLSCSSQKWMAWATNHIEHCSGRCWWAIVSSQRTSCSRVARRLVHDDHSPSCDCHHFRQLFFFLIYFN